MGRPNRGQSDWPQLRVHPQLRDDLNALAADTGLSIVSVAGLALRLGLPRLRAEMGLATTTTHESAAA